MLLVIERSLVSLVYLTITRPDITYYVHVVNQFVPHPTTVYWAAVLRILRYLQGTTDRALLMPFTPSFMLYEFSNSNSVWAGEGNDHRSTTGFTIFLGSSLISWKSKK